MKINISKRNIEVTPAMHDYIEDKLVRLERHLAKISHVDVTVAKDGLTYTVEALVHNDVGHFEQIHALGKTEDFYASVDSLEDKLLRQIDKKKEKQTKKWRRN